MVTNGSGKTAVSDVTSTELDFLDGVTSAIQTQLDSKAALAGATFTGDVTLTNTDGGSSASPIIVLDRQSASPADSDYLGRVQFKGKDDGGSNETYAQISGKIIDASAGSEDGAIEFSVKKAGSSTIAARLRSDKLQLLNSTQLTVDGSSEFTGTVTMSDEVTMTDDLIITGNLTVNGDTTTINTTNMDVDDTMIMLANGTTGSPANDIGILFNRGAQGNAAFFYDESAKTFKLSDTKDPKSNTSLSPVTASNLDVGILTAATVKFDGADLSTAISDNVSTLNTSITALETRRTNNIAGAISTVLTSDLTASRALVAGSGGKIEVSAVTSTELGYLDGVTSAVQTQIDSKQATITGAATTIDDTDLTASRALVSSGSGKVAVSAVTSTELGYLDGVSSAIQTQLDAKSTTSNAAALAAEDVALQSRLATNVTAFTNEDTALQARITANNTLTSAVETRRTQNIAGAVSSITTSDLTASRALASDSSGKVAVSAVTSTELGYLDGVTSAIQTQIDSKQATITGAATTIDDADLTASRALVSSGSGKVAVSAVTSTELGYLDGVSSAIQTQLDAKSTTSNAAALAAEDVALQARITANNTLTSAVETRRTQNIAGAVSTITTSDLTASRAMVTNGSGKVAVSDVTATELGYLDGVTSAIQTQLDAKLASAGANNFTSNVTITSTSEGNENNPELALVRNSGSPATNDLLGTFVFKGKNDAAEEVVYASFQTRANDVSDGTEDGNMFFKVMTNGTLEDRLALKGANPTLFSSQPVRLNSVDLEFRASSKTTTVTPGSPSGDITITLPATTSTLATTTTTDALETRRAANIAGAVSTITTSDLTASRALVSSGSGKVAVSAVTATELGYLDGVTSAIQTQLDAKSTTSNAAALAAEDVALQARITANNTLTTAVETRRTQNIAGAVSTITTSDLTASRAMVTNGSGKVAVSAVTATELGYLDGVSSAIQTQLDAKQATITGAATTIDDADLTASRALVSSGSGKVAVSAVTSTELGYLDGVTSAIQTQIDAVETRRSANNITTTFSDDVTITGNLTINGDTTTVSTTNMLVEDALIELQTGLTGSNSNDIGFIFERGSTGNNGMLFWDESEDEFAFATGTETGASTGSLSIGAYADIAAKNITVSGTVDGIDIAGNAAALASEDAGIEARRVANIAGAVSTITTSDLTASRAVVTNSSGKVAVSAVTSTELGYLDGVSSAIQTQLNAKQATITGAATTIDDTDLTASRALVSSGSGKVAVSAVTSTELGYLDGVTSAIQTQFTAAETRRTNNIAGAVSTITTSDLTASRAMVTNGSGKVAVSAVTSTELGYLDGVTSAIQTQLDAKSTTANAAALAADIASSGVCRRRRYNCKTRC